MKNLLLILMLILTSCTTLNYSFSSLQPRKMDLINTDYNSRCELTHNTHKSIFSFNISYKSAKYLDDEGYGCIMIDMYNSSLNTLDFEYFNLKIKGSNGRIDEYMLSNGDIGYTSYTNCYYNYSLKCIVEQWYKFPIKVKIYGGSNSTFIWKVEKDINQNFKKETKKDIW